MVQCPIILPEYPARAETFTTPNNFSIVNFVVQSNGLFQKKKCTPPDIEKREDALVARLPLLKILDFQGVQGKKFGGNTKGVI